MALVTCHISYTKLAYDAPNCPKCGTLGPKLRKTKKLILYLRLFGFVVIVALLGYIWFVLIPKIKLHGLFNKGGQIQQVSIKLLSV